MKTNRTCSVCHQDYYYCPSCDKNDEYWRILTCSENCRKILNVLQRHSGKELTDEQACKELNSCDLSVLETAHEVVKKQANAILNAGKPEEKPVKMAPKKKVVTHKEMNDEN